MQAAIFWFVEVACFSTLFPNLEECKWDLNNFFSHCIFWQLVYAYMSLLVSWLLHTMHFSLSYFVCLIVKCTFKCLEKWRSYFTRMYILIIKFIKLDCLIGCPEKCPRKKSPSENCQLENCAPKNYPSEKWSRKIVLLVFRCCCWHYLTVIHF